jgi:putative NADPH-quinone reductase
MHCLIVTAHPAAKGLTHHLGDVVQTGLQVQGHQIARLDLGQSGFAPALSSAEWQSHFAPPFDAAQVQPQIDALLTAKVLVLIAPIWWAGLPATMKGWFDRVWAPGHAFDPHSSPGQIKPLLSGLRHVVLITTHAAPAWVDWLVHRRPVQRMLRHSLLRLCAPQARLTSLSIYRAENLTPERLAAAISRIDRVVARLSKR